MFKRREAVYYLQPMFKRREAVYLQPMLKQREAVYYLQPMLKQREAVYYLQPMLKRREAVAKERRRRLPHSTQFSRGENRGGSQSPASEPAVHTPVPDNFHTPVPDKCFGSHQLRREYVKKTSVMRLIEGSV